VGRKLAKDPGSGIRGTIIQNNDFQIRVILREQTLYTGADVSLFVASWNTDRNQWRIGGWWRRRLDDDIEMILVMQPVNDKDAPNEEGSGENEINHGNSQRLQVEGRMGLSLNL
jgi:hypothetical protein